MKIIDTKTHGYIDYIMGIFLLAAPSLFGFNMNGKESIVLYVAGIAVIIYSLLTDYEVSFFKLIPMQFHLILDILSGILLAASPWILGFSEIVYGHHVTLGVIEIAAALMTRTVPERTRIEIRD
ncbi:SPW repeat domain-containing protein [Flavobacterium sp.]|uniref:SPW repeat domain-containing protein n=1 Tax=Flavobacterium sp. TaxID=239 RepID=UPI002BAA2338|nr:SPW repeat protein [Flavobacterium sp.]HSD06234.1 SPW repeat protein [Flavobacterium sp.]